MSDPTEQPEEPQATGLDEAEAVAGLDEEPGLDIPADDDASLGEDIGSALAEDPSLTDALPPAGNMNRSSAFMGVPIEILICVGKARPLVSDLVKLRRDSVISLDSKIEDPVEIYIGDRLIARGELQEMEESEGQLGVRLTEVADLSNGV